MVASSNSSQHLRVDGVCMRACVCTCILSLQLLNGCQQKSKSVSGEEFSEIEEKLRDTVSRLSAMEQERDEIAQQNYELKQQV